MIKSALDPFLERRLESIETVDKQAFPPSTFDQPLSKKHSSAFSKSLKTNAKNSKPKVLAEVKKKSPSLGSLTEAKAIDLCKTFVEAGAHAISVLVDQVHFNGHPQDLLDCKLQYQSTPFLYKDFVLTEYQVHLASHIGADSILLMTQVLDDQELEKLYQLSLSLGLEPFIEVHTYTQYERALTLKPTIIGINARDFSTKGLPVHLNNAGKLLHTAKENNTLTTDIVMVAQSGIDSPQSYTTVCEACPESLPDAVQVGSSISSSGKVPNWLF